MRNCLTKASLFEPKKSETFSAVGPYKTKQQWLPSAGKGVPGEMINLVKTPRAKSLDELSAQDPVAQAMQTLLLMQLVAGQSGNKPMIGPEAAGPLIGAQLLTDDKKTAAADKPDKLEELAGKGIHGYAKNIVKQLTPEHYAAAGGSTTEETVRNLVEDIIPRQLVREHAARLGRGNVDLGSRMLEQYLSASLQDTGETLPRVLTRMLTGHVQGMREADKQKAMLDLNIDAGLPHKTKAAPSWLDIIKKNAPKPEHDPNRGQHALSPADDVSKYGSAPGSIPYRPEVLQEKLATFLGTTKKVLTHPLTLGLGAAAMPVVLDSAWPSILAGGLGVAGGALAHHMMGPRKLDLSDKKIDPFYQPVDGKARALTVDPDILRTVFAENPQVGALARSVDPKTLAMLGAAGDPTVSGKFRRFMAHISGQGRALDNAEQVLKHIVYATHGDVGRKDWRDHLETITGQQGHRSGEFLSDILRSATGNRGALGGMSAARSLFGNMNIKDDFGDQVRQLLLQRLAVPAQAR